ncbi:PAS domain S-box protein [Caenimonas sedimenti]|uniref:histidine kinase n=1 Tax=Caenimonas sedimenti TaxID=2596921 RepID=A0A562ZTC4_9BURK|nr:ATP-binding protein [Caenimonas sedimenti]TWO71743.1 PAS domain S-box protein [Caenimonas sedimenti]
MSGPPSPSVPAFLAGGGELSRLIATHDWAATELGPLQSWPAHIKTATALMLRSQVPLVMLWGESGRMIYNDAYAHVAGGRHPGLLGSEVRRGWEEVADFNDHVMKVGLAGGNLSYKDQELVLFRNGVAEQVWMDLDYSPLVDDTGQPVGVMAVVIETTDKVRARHVVQGERERLARLFEQAPSFMALLDGPQHRFVLANPRYVQLVGRDVAGATVADALPDAAAQGYVELLDRVYQSGQPYSAFDARYRIQPSPDVPAVERFVDFLFQPIRGETGAVSGIFVQGVDVTHRVTAERRTRALNELSERFRALEDWQAVQYAASEILGRALGVSRVGYGTIDPDAETLHVERDWTAAGVDTLAGVTHLRDYGSFIDSLKQGEFISIADVRTDPRTAPAAAALEGRSARSFVNVPVLEQGRLVAVLFVNHAELREWTAEEHAFIRDVAERTRIATQRSRAEKALRDSEARFRTIADAMPQMVWSTLPDGYHDYYNQQWYDFTGAAPGTTDGESWNGMFHPDDQPHAWEVWRHSLATGATYEIEYRLRHRSGQYRWVLGRALPVRSEAGEIVRWMGTCTDIHEQKTAREELLANNRRKDEFLAMLAHELRNPLAPISMAAHLLKSAPSDAAYVERSAGIISRQVLHMTELVDDLLDVSRVTRGLVELERVPVDLKAVLGNAIEQVRPMIEARGHELTTRMAAGDVAVLGDRTRLVQVMSNLLNNAAKYTPPGGALSMTLVVVDRNVEVRVADNGSGIDANLLPHVFDLFTQGERTPDRAQGGLGLGLALVRSLVELHGGRVSAQSEGRGKGSVFTVTLPELAGDLPDAQSATPGAALADDSQALRVMVVDDNQDAAETLGVLLETLGHDVRVAHDATQALKAVEGGARDVFILDIGLPGVDGYELARRLRAHPHGSAATYIALTGYGGAQDKQRGDEAGFDHYLVKPADLGELERLLQLAGGG